MNFLDWFVIACLSQVYPWILSVIVLHYQGDYCGLWGIALKASEACDLSMEKWELMCERGFRQDPRDPDGNDIRLGVDTANVVPNIVAKQECCSKACQATADWADGATFLQPSFALSVVALKEEDGMQVR